MLRAAGIRTGVGMAPILPGISDSPAQLEEVVQAAKAAGAVFVWANVLYLRPGTREHFLESLAKHWPELLPRYERMYSSAYLSKHDAEPILQTAAELRRRHHVGERERFVQPQPHETEQLQLLAG
jgi:DNA repair photolyase